MRICSRRASDSAAMYRFALQIKRSKFFDAFLSFYVMKWFILNFTFYSTCCATNIWCNCTCWEQGFIVSCQRHINNRFSWLILFVCPLVFFIFICVCICIHVCFIVCRSIYTLASHGVNELHMLRLHVATASIPMSIWIYEKTPNDLLNHLYSFTTRHRIFTAAKTNPNLIILAKPKQANEG